MKISEILIGKVLLIGVIISAVIVLFGGILFLSEQGLEPHINPTFSLTRDAFLFHSMVQGIWKWDAGSWIMLGLSMLLLTQLVRVFLTAWFFEQRKENFYFWVSVFILGVLVYSLWRGI